MKKKIVILLLIVIISITAVTYYFISNINKTKNTITTSLTPSIITRLQGYPYFRSTPMHDFKEMAKLDSSFSKMIVDTFFKYIVKFDSNEKFFTNEKLVYVTSDNHYVVRGILQRKMKDGTFIEQDVEYEYRHSTFERKPVRLYYVGKRLLNYPKTIRGDNS